jgi:hypothetical protein
MFFFTNMQDPETHKHKKTQYIGCQGITDFFIADSFADLMELLEIHKLMVELPWHFKILMMKL